MAVSRTPNAFKRLIPMAAQPVSALPEGDDWLYEIKLDGSPYSRTVTVPQNARVASTMGRRSAEGTPDRNLNSRSLLDGYFLVPSLG